MSEDTSNTDQLSPPDAERVVVVARLKDDAHDVAQRLIAAGPPFDPGAIGLQSHGVYLSGGEVVFLFEGTGAVRRLSDLVNDVVTSASFSAWAPLLEDTPRLAHELYHWTA